MDRLEELATLVTVIDEGSLVQAARRLQRSPPAITRMLAALEQRCGVRLVERTTRRLAPTESGRALAARARELLADYAVATSDQASAPVRGLIRVSAPVQFGRLHMSGIVSRFLDAYPDVRVDLQLNDRNVDLIDEGVDLALRIGKLEISGLMARRVGSVRRVVVASPQYLERRGVPEGPAALTRHDIIFGSSHARPSEWRFDSRPRGRVVRFTPRLSVNEVESQLIAARAGRGIARLLSYQVARDIASGTLQRILENFEGAPLPVQLVTPSPRLSPKVRAFLETAAAELERLDVLHEAPADRPVADRRLRARTRPRAP